MAAPCLPTGASLSSNNPPERTSSCRVQLAVLALPKPLARCHRRVPSKERLSPGSSGLCLLPAPCHCFTYCGCCRCCLLLLLLMLLLLLLLLVPADTSILVIVHFQCGRTTRLSCCSVFRPGSSRFAAPDRDQPHLHPAFWDGKYSCGKKTTL